ncbi:MAG: hypothetical protein K6E58_06705 [Eubacterium sp.]|nr:hypothetical protein [Eubacterium sp.]
MPNEKGKVKTVLSKIWDYIEGTHGLILIIYTSLVLSTQAFLNKQGKYLLRWIFLAVVFSVIVCPLFLKLAKKIRIKLNYSNTTKVERKYKILFFLIPFAVLFVMYLIHYPGGFVSDTISQYYQVLDNKYTDWHPVIQTFLTFTVPYKLTGGWIGSIILFQIIIFSIAIAYSLCTITKYVSVKYAVVSMIFILIYPGTVVFGICPIKDTPFGIGALVLMTYAFQIYMTKGAWIQKIGNCALFIIVLALTTLFRHNAILFTIPLLFAVFFFMQKKRTFVIICIGVIALVVGVKYPIYNAFNVEKPDQRQVETLGVPLNVISSVVKYSPEKADKETKEFVYKIAPKNVFEKYYKYGDFNSVKYNLEYCDLDIIEKFGTKKILSIALKSTIASPKEAIKGAIKTTNTAYTLTDNYKFDYYPRVSKNTVNLRQTGFPILKEWTYHLRTLISLLFPHIFLYIGAMHLILIISILAKFKLRNWKSWKRIFFILPVFAYNYISALLLTYYGEGDRYFWYIFILMPMLLLFVYGYNAKKEEYQEEK